jgi:hypothetical protein
VKYFLTVLVWITAVSTVHAGVVSLTSPEIMKLRALTASSPDAALWARLIEETADDVLTQTPHPVEDIQSAGKLKGSAEKIRTEKALDDFRDLKNLKWAYALTWQNNYLKKAEEYVLAWAKTCRPPENPIDATNLETLIETYDLIRPQMNPSDQQVVDNWLKSVIDTLFASEDPSKNNYRNNWQAHRLKIISMAAFVLGDTATEQRALGELKTLMAVNLNADGTTFDFSERDALHYHVYDLEPLIRTAILYQRGQNLDLYHWTTDKGASMVHCVAFLIPYADKEKTHPEWVHTTVQFDIQRGQNHEKGYTAGENFDPQRAQKCLELAQFFEPDLKDLVGTLAENPTSAYPSFQILINEVARPEIIPQKPPS